MCAVMIMLRFRVCCIRVAAVQVYSENEGATGMHVIAFTGAT